MFSIWEGGISGLSSLLLKRRKNERSLTRTSGSANIFFEELMVPSHCDRIHSSITAVHSFDDRYIGKQPLAWKELCAEYWLTHSHTPFDAPGKRAF